jgi:hypothetical protein
MVDLNAAIQTFMRRPAVVAFTDTRIWPGTTPPAGYTPAAGPAVCFAIRGGPMDATGRIALCSTVVRYYAASEEQSTDTWRASMDAWHDQKDGTVSAQLDVLPQSLTDPSTRGWLFTFAIWTFRVKNH